MACSLLAACKRDVIDLLAVFLRVACIALIFILRALPILNIELGKSKVAKENSRKTN
jgi:hypothetical protein